MSLFLSDKVDWITWMVYGSQIFCNIFWPVIAFYMRMITAAFCDLVILDVLTVYNIVLFYGIVPLSGYLLIPYLGFTIFCTWLNYNLMKKDKEKKQVNLKVKRSFPRLIIKNSY
eukprot:TRINITY_DN8_c3_g1_i2.p1 TRINITY_DN8_c3_g1~~TRINITY_DN8_c3_g1_i2.p1  ORF type:complete len:114 (-),score=13.75 TRINITY_DN8_c3_g1_i2:119-460(-)